MNWLLFLHQIPPSPPYFRTKVLRRLNQIGALAIKNSAYVLPGGDDPLEDLQWLRRSIEEDGGEAWLFSVEAIGGLTDETILDSFRKLRAPDYADLVDTARALLEDLRVAPQEHASRCRKLKRRYDDLTRIDFFDAPGRKEMETLMNEIDRIQNARTATAPPTSRLDDLKGRTWVTRRGVKVDRIGSAWLIRRFIDPAAKFGFVDPENQKGSPNEIRFDMFEGEFTHRDDRCTFEVLLDVSGAADRGLRAIAEVVHDLDLKDSKYQRSETSGIAAMINGIVLRHTDDSRRLEEGATLFDALYEQFRTEP